MGRKRVTAAVLARILPLRAKALLVCSNNSDETAYGYNLSTAQAGHATPSPGAASVDARTNAQVMNSSLSGSKFKVTGLFKAAYRWLCDDEEQPSSKTPPTGPVALPPDLPPPPTEPPRRVTASVATLAGDTLQLPLRPVLDTLPRQLKEKLRQPVVGNLTFPVSIATIMAQLPQGTVQITFGELRLAAAGVFTLTTDCDQVMVSLPLSEILPRINLAQLARRNDQKTVQVPDEVSSPFNARGQGLTIGNATETPPPVKPPTPGLIPDTGEPSFPHISSPRSIPGSRPGTPMPPRAIAPTPPAVAMRPPTPTPPPIPAAKPSPHASLPWAAPATARRSSGNVPAVPPQTIARPIAPQPGPSSVTAAAASPAAALLQVPLASLTQNWPPSVRLEIAQLNLKEATVALPTDTLEQGLRRGKLCFPWKTVRSWMRPSILPQVSANDGTVLELPLSVIAPLFIARRPAPPSRQRKVTVDETIPNLFFGFPQPDSGPGIGNATPVAAPAPARAPDTNFYVWGDENDVPHVETVATPAPESAGTDFTRRYATPNEIVARAAELEGVEGALVALADGLAVANRVPPQVNADTLAAFLPQIFAKVSQCTRELRMGDLNNLNFTVGNVPWKIFRVHGVFFAAFGRAGAGLPTAQLAALAAELDRKPKAA